MVGWGWILSQGPRSCPDLGEWAGMWQGTVWLQGTWQRQLLWRMSEGLGMETRPCPQGCWVHEGATRAAKGTTDALRGSFRPAGQGFGATQLPPVLVSAGQ